MAKQSKISPERVRFLFDYDPNTGVLKRVVYQTQNRLYSEIKDHTATIFIDGERHSKARCVWAHYYGEWPPTDREIDHINGQRKDNRIVNLRLATANQNGFNRIPPTNAAGVTGVTPSGNPKKPWIAQIRIDGKKINLGRFETKEQAAAVYEEMSMKHHGEFKWQNPLKVRN